MMKGWRIILAVLLVMGTVSYAQAGYFEIGDIQSGEYTYFPTPTAWDPGANTAREEGFPAPGGATWSIMGAGFSDVSTWDTVHSGTTGTITSLGVSGYAIADYGTMIDATLDVWAAVSDFSNLGQVADGGVNAGASKASGGHLGDIRVAAWEIVTGITLAHAYQPGTQDDMGGPGRWNIGGDAHFDVDRTWVDDPNDVSGNSRYDLFTVMLHEFGHSLGLGHSTAVGSVMEAAYAGSRRILQADDVAGIQSIYGIPEPGSIAALLGMGITALIGYRWRRKKRAA